MQLLTVVPQLVCVTGPQHPTIPQLKSWMDWGYMRSSLFIDKTMLGQTPLQFLQN